MQSSVDQIIGGKTKRVVTGFLFFDFEKEIREKERKR